MKKIVLGISGGISFVIFLILLITTNYLGRSQLSQTAASRWSDKGNASQVSCFFSVGAGVTQDSIIDFEHTVDSALVDASVVQESGNPGARLWADAYSADGQVTLSSGKTSLTADAIGIGGDFFLFHPLKLLHGAYFSGNDLMQDYCVIDEDAAWQLFGSNDVAGMTVEIGGVPHIVTGVVERPSGHLAEAAGLDSTLVYVSYQTLSELGTSHGINHYEIVMPNPVTGFAENFIRESLGADEKETEVLENTTRYSFLSRLQLLTLFGVRSMNGKAIIYPYWENIARGYEDILALMTLFELLFLAYALILALVFFCIWWKHKGWTLRDVRLMLMDKAERRVERAREEKQGKRKNKKQKKDREAIGKIDFEDGILEETESGRNGAGELIPEEGSLEGADPEEGPWNPDQEEEYPEEPGEMIPEEESWNPDQKEEYPEEPGEMIPEEESWNPDQKEEYPEEPGEMIPEEEPWNPDQKEEYPEEPGETIPEEGSQEETDSRETDAGEETSGEPRKEKKRFWGKREKTEHVKKERVKKERKKKEKRERDRKKEDEGGEL